MTDQRWAATSAYILDLFGREDDHLRGLSQRAAAAGLPDIAVTGEVGRLLAMLTSMAGGRRAVEVGTLGGYSGTWIARGLREGGRLITVEANDTHADFAEREFAAARLSGRVEIRRGPALEVLPRLARELGPGSVDLVFLDAVKSELSSYFELVRPLIPVGGMLVADNALGGGRGAPGPGEWWIDTPAGTNTDRDGTDRFNRIVAGDPDFEGVIVPLRQGVLVACRVGIGGVRETVERGRGRSDASRPPP